MAFHPLPLSGPTTLRIAADVLRGPTDYANDHIWEASAAGDPAGLSLRTTFGRRAAEFSVFPSFAMGGPTISNPADFHRQPSLEAILPSYLRLRFEPLEGLEVVLEVRVVDSHTLAGRVGLTNRSYRFRPVRMGLQANLLPLPDGAPMVPQSFAGVTALAGRSGGLEPVVFLAAGAIAEPGRIPSLVVHCELTPGAGRSYAWAESAAAAAEESFDRARQAAGQLWDAEAARLERIHAGWVEVASGNEEWDTLFHLSQQNALASFVGPARLAPRPTLVLHRSPERGHSASGDGRDHSDGWAGPTALEAYHVVRQMAWASPELASAVLRSFWASQRPDGTIDARPGPAGQAAGFLCPPLLASLTLHLDRILRDDGFLQEGFHALWPFFRTWFRPPNDRDGDGWPEWDQAAQIPWPGRWGGAGEPRLPEPNRVEDPALLALLYREADALGLMADRLGRTEASRELADRRAQLRGLLARAWSVNRRTYLRLDRETHRSGSGEIVAAGIGPQKSSLARALAGSGRLILSVFSDRPSASAMHVRIRGRVESGRVRVQTLTAADLRWEVGAGVAACDLVFASVDSIEVSGLDSETAWRLEAAALDAEDLALLLPLWAGMVDREQAAVIVRRLMEPSGFLRRHGLATVPADSTPPTLTDLDPARRIHAPLNLLLGEGLIRYGYSQQAEDLLTRWMEGILGSLRSDHGLPEAIDADHPSNLGRRHHLNGLPPLSLFLDLHGLGLQSPRSLRLASRGDGLPPVSVRWRGLEVRRTGAQAEVRFPSGARATHELSEDVVVEEMVPVAR